MPALKEEVDTFQWFDGTSLDGTDPVIDEALVDNFDWVFGDYGLGENLQGTIFAAFKENEPAEPAHNTPLTSASTSGLLPHEPVFSTTHNSTSPIETTDNSNINNNDLSSWYAQNAEMTQAVNPSAQMQTYEFPSSFGIDPTVLGGGSDGSRPASAPGGDVEGMGMLSAPVSGQMSRR
jgi:hypothetical protein